MERDKLDYRYTHGCNHVRAVGHLAEIHECAGIQFVIGKWQLGMEILNVKLLKSPINWFTIFFMLLIAAIAGHLFLTWFGIEPATGS